MRDWLERWFFPSGKPKQVADEPKPVVPFVPGMTLAPGESAELKIEIPPECQELMRAARDRGEVVGFEQRGTKQIGPGRYRMRVALVAGDQVLKVLEVEYLA